MNLSIIENILGTSVWLMLYVIYLKSPKHSYHGEYILHRGVGTKSAMQSQYHWEFAQNLAINLLYALAVIALIINILISGLYFGNIINETVYMFYDIFLILILGATFYFVIENTVKNLPIQAKI